MGKNIFAKLFTVLTLALLISLMGCNTEDVNYKTPALKLDKLQLKFEASGTALNDGDSFTIETNRDWTISVPEADKSWIRLSEEKGSGTKTIKVTVLPNGESDRTARLKVLSSINYEYVEISQVGSALTLYNITFGTGAASSSPYEFLDQWISAGKGLGESGQGAATVDLLGGGTASVSPRASGKLSTGYPDASGANKLFFSSGSPTFVIDKISTNGGTQLKLTFGVSRYINNDGAFTADKLVVSAGAGAATLSNVTYTFVAADEGWNYATAEISLAAPSEFLTIKFSPAEASAISLDDITVIALDAQKPTTPIVTTVAATNIAGTAADLGGTYILPQDVTADEVGVSYKVSGTESYANVLAETVVTPFSVSVTGLTANTEYTYKAYVKVGTEYYYGAEMTVTPTVSVTPIYYENVGGTDVSSTTQLDAFTGWLKEGSAASGVTYTGINVTVRKTSSSSGYDGASGGNCAFFGAVGHEFIINDIDITGKTNFTFKFGISRQIFGTGFVAVDASTIKLWASVDGSNYAPLTFANSTTAGWVLASSEFKVPAGPAKLYLKFNAGAAPSEIRLDDFTLIEGGNGSEIVIPPITHAIPKTIADIRALKTNVPSPTNTYTITDSWVIEGATLVSNKATGHVQTYQLAIQDGTSANSGIMINLKGTGTVNPFELGDKVDVVVKNAILKNYSGLLQLEVNLNDITKTASGSPMTATSISPSQLANYESMYVAIENTQVLDAQGQAVLNNGDNPNFVMEVSNSTDT